MTVTDTYNIREKVSKNLDNLMILQNKIRHSKNIQIDYLDIGNAIGLAIGKLSEQEKSDFLLGLNHGLSLENGTHE